MLEHYPVRPQELPRRTAIGELVERVAVLLQPHGLTLVTAESCTGGLVSAALTALPGSSDWYLGGMITYSNASKRELLGVNSASLERHGAVSAVVALEMACGARERFSATVAVSVTGIAGPGGAVEGKPVGRVWIGVATPYGSGATRHTFPGDRSEVRSAAVRAALLSVIAWAGAAAVVPPRPKRQA